MNERLKTFRETLNISQEALGSRINVTRSHISSIEKGKRTLTDRIISDICREFNVNEEWLRYGTGEMFVEPDTFSLDEYAVKHNLTSLELSIMKSYIELDEDVRHKILSSLKSIFNKENTNEIAVSEDTFANSIVVNDEKVSEIEIDTKVDDDIKKEVQAFKTELEAEKKGQMFTVSENTNKDII